MVTVKELAAIAAEAYADLAEMYRENLSKFPGVENTYKRYVLREKVVEHQDRCAEIMAQLAAQEAR